MLLLLLLSQRLWDNVVVLNEIFYETIVVRLSNFAHNVYSTCQQYFQYLTISITMLNLGFIVANCFDIFDSLARCSGLIARHTEVKNGRSVKANKYLCKNEIEEMIRRPICTTH